MFGLERRKACLALLTEVRIGIPALEEATKIAQVYGQEAALATLPQNKAAWVAGSRQEGINLVNALLVHFPKVRADSPFRTHCGRGNPLFGHLRHTTETTPGIEHADRHSVSSTFMNITRCKKQHCAMWWVEMSLRLLVAKSIREGRIVCVMCENVCVRESRERARDRKRARGKENIKGRQCVCGLIGKREEPSQIRSFLSLLCTYQSRKADRRRKGESS